jgi:arsenate reductase
MTKKVLFLCTHNSARSQIAEGWMKSLFPKDYSVFSAGTEPTMVHPIAIQVMKEVDIDISGQTSKSVDQFVGQEFDYVITLCHSAKESCPLFSRTKQMVHLDFPDPTQDNENEQEKAFRHVRDEMKEFLLDTFAPSPFKVKS